MGVFDKIMPKRQNSEMHPNHITTQGFCIGIPEAEAEATTVAIKLVM